MCFIEGNVLTVFLSYNSDDYNYLEVDCVVFWQLSCL